MPLSTPEEPTSEKAQLLKQVGALGNVTLFIILIGYLGARMIDVMEVVLIEVLRPGVVALEDMRDTYSPDDAKKRR
jgi:hypothetical protein